MATTSGKTPGQYKHTVRRPDGSISHDATTDVPSSFTTTTKPDRSRDRKATGWLYPKPYAVASRTTCVPTGLIDTRYPNGWRETFSGSLQVVGGYSVQTPEWDHTIVTEAEIDALLRVKDSKINLGVAWAEASKTADMISSKVLQLARAAKKARKGDIPGAINALGGKGRQRTASNWAELQWGWLPLVGDIYGGAEALAQRQLPSQWLITGKGVKRYNYKDSTIVNGFAQHRVETEGMRGAFVRLDYLPGNDFFSALKSLGLGNPAEIAWELLPYSFVVDYLWPVGDWLSSLDAAVGLQFLSGSCTRRAEMVGRLVSTGKIGPTDRVADWCYYTGYARDFWMDRSVYGESPIPFPPPPKNPFSAKKVVNALSLLALAFGRK